MKTKAKCMECGRAMAGREVGDELPSERVCDACANADEANTILVFVYGTLMRGGHNDHLLTTADFVGEARTGGGWALFSCGFFPAMARAWGEAGRVTGEVWRVNARTLARLDILEGVSSGHYRREAIAVFLAGRRAPICAQVYTQGLARQGGRACIVSGSWRAHLAAGGLS